MSKQLDLSWRSVLSRGQKHCYDFGYASGRTNGLSILNSEYNDASDFTFVDQYLGEAMNDLSEPGAAMQQLLRRGKAAMREYYAQMQREAYPEILDDYTTFDWEPRVFLSGYAAGLLAVWSRWTGHREEYMATAARRKR